VNSSAWACEGVKERMKDEGKTEERQRVRRNGRVQEDKKGG
jgi:hypothetical protein